MRRVPDLGLTARAVLERVIDGDTIDVSLLIPFRIRLLDCWAPETRGDSRHEGLNSKRALQKIVPVGERLLIQVPTGQADSADDILSFGRVLGHAWRDSGELHLAEWLVSQGLATKEKQQ